MASRGEQSTEGIPARASLQDAYSAYRESVLRDLAHFGVAPADLHDMCHEVFLVVHAHRDQMAQVQQLQLWLRTICWRVAAGYRRRSHRRHEIAMDQPPEIADDGSGLPLEEIERRQERDLLLAALDELNDEMRDLLALHDLGDVPMTLIAELLECDRKTAHKRLALARRRLANLLRDGAADRDKLGGREKDWPALDRDDSALLSSELQVLELRPTVNVGLIGNVMITCWPREAPLEALEAAAAHFDDIAELCGNRGVYFAVIGPAARPPPLAARKRISELLRGYAGATVAYGTALQGGMSWIARPIMTGLARLTRTPFPMRFFQGIPATAAWLAGYSRGPDGPLTAAALEAAVTHLSQLQPTELAVSAAKSRK